MILILESWCHENSVILTTNLKLITLWMASGKHGKHLFRILEFNTVTATSLTSLVPVPSTLELVVAESLAAASPHQGCSQGLFLLGCFFLAVVFVVFFVICFGWFLVSDVFLNVTATNAAKGTISRKRPMKPWAGKQHCRDELHLSVLDTAYPWEIHRNRGPKSLLQSLRLKCMHLNFAPLDHVPHIPATKSLWQVTSSDTRVQCKGVKDHLMSDLRNLW